MLQLIPLFRTLRIAGFILVTTALFSCQTGNQERTQEEAKPQMDGLEQAMLQEFKMTRDPQLGYIPRERLGNARIYMETLRGQGGSTERLTALGWVERGPDNIGGRTRTIMIDKRDVSGNTVFAGSVSGGIFKTTNFTNPVPTWTIVNDFLPNLAISNLIQDAAHPDTMYATTGEGWYNIDAVRGAGIYKSTDGGNTWNQMPSTTGFEYVQDMVIDNNGNFFVTLRNLISLNRGVMRSTDRGNTWTQVLGLPLVGFNTGRAADLEVASNGDIYASLGIQSRSEIYKSTFATHGANTGALGTWTNITPFTTATTQRAEILLAPSDPQRVYLLMQDSATSQVLIVYRSSNGGANWFNLTAPAALNNNVFSQTWFNLIGAVDPNNENTLVVGGLNLARSTNSGDSWTTITNSGSVHVDHHALIYDGSSKLLNGNDGGVYYSANINSTGIPNFSNKNIGYNVTQYYACDAHPTNANYFLAGAQDNGTQKFTNAGINSTATVTGGDGGFCHIDQTDGQLQITSTTGNNYYRSLNGGTSFASLGSSINNNRGQFINPTDLDDAQKILYAGDDAGKYYFISGLTGTPAASTVTVGLMGNQELTAVKVDPHSSNTIWIGASYGTPLAVPKVMKLTSANTTNPTVQVVANISGVPSGSAISSIDVDPANASHILVTLSNFGVTSVWESTNGGTSYTSIEGNLPDMPVRWGIFAPLNAQLNGTTGGDGGILLGTELGVWTTSVISGAATQWIPNNNGLANVRVDMLRYRPSDNTVAAATHGRGLFTTTLPTVVTGINDPVNTKDFIRYINSENNRLLIVTGTLPTRTMTIQLFDMSGRNVYRSAGQYRNTTIGLDGLPGGIYMLRCTGDKKENFVQKFVK